MNEDTLQQHLSRAQTAADREVAHAKAKGKSPAKPHIKDHWGNDPGSYPAVAPSTSKEAATLSKLSETEEGSIANPPAVVTFKRPALLVDHMWMFKGKAATEMMQGEFINAEGEVNFRPFGTLPGGDFNRNVNAWCFSEEEETAELYRCYAARRCPNSETWLIAIQVPKAFLVSLKLENLFYGSN